ncbi:hypothetical protein CORC01_07965 [Colletotrichum orchidophilum]|uniref:Uncharacterized protein n=1 Tax=Colletotrichum orchidophilum TaxID=1209926 RepID=A0A1G4B5U9_9PEZI|nr:uncharacterized protein CORC01_07965 [Colletotrichum orchidophilum]OHE96819.1 hypothetical protein CORC01_07965 [Colletotrichum orchidophilum]
METMANDCVQAFSSSSSSPRCWRGSKHVQLPSLPLCLANHPAGSRFPPPINAQSMREEVNLGPAQMFPTAADSESFWQTNRVMNASAGSAPTPSSHRSATRHWGSCWQPHQELVPQSDEKEKDECTPPHASRSPQSSPHLHLAFARERPSQKAYYQYLVCRTGHPRTELIALNKLLLQPILFG